MAKKWTGNDRLSKISSGAFKSFGEGPAESGVSVPTGKYWLASKPETFEALAEFASVYDTQIKSKIWPGDCTARELVELCVRAHDAENELHGHRMHCSGRTEEDLWRIVAHAAARIPIILAALQVEAPDKKGA